MKNTSNKMAEMPMNKLVINMALPIAIALAVHSLYNIVDSIFVSRISLDAFNAVSIAMPIQQLVNSIGIGFAVGINAIMSKTFGENNNSFIDKIVSNSYLIMGICSIFFILFGIFAIESFISAQTSNEIIKNYSIQYLRIICCFSCFGFFELMQERFLISNGKTSYSMISQIVGTIFNLCMDPIFIFVFRLGVMGAAISTVISQFISMALSFYFNYKYNKEINVFIKNIKPDFHILVDINKIAIPAIITNFAIPFMAFCMNIILYNYTYGKDISQNIFGIYLKINTLAFLPIMGIGYGIISIIAFNIGQKNIVRIRDAILISTRYCVIICLVATIIFWIFPRQFLSLFMGASTIEEKKMIYSIGIFALRIISLSFAFAGVNMMFSSMFQGMGRGIFASIPPILRQVIILVPTAYILAKYGMANGSDLLVWFSFVISEIITLILTIILFRIQYKKLIKIYQKE